MADQQLNIGVRVDASQATAGFNTAQAAATRFANTTTTQLRGVGVASKELSKTFGALGQALFAGLIVKGLLDIAAAGDKANSSLAIAAQTAKNLGKSFDPSAMRKWAEAFSQSAQGGGYSLSQIYDGIQRFVSVGATGVQTENLLGLAANFAAGRHIEFSEAVQLLT